MLLGGDASLTDGDVAERAGCSEFVARQEREKLRPKPTPKPPKPLVPAEERAGRVLALARKRGEIGIADAAEAVGGSRRHARRTLETCWQQGLLERRTARTKGSPVFYRLPVNCGAEAVREAAVVAVGGEGEHSGDGIGRVIGNALGG